MNVADEKTWGQMKSLLGLSSESSLAQIAAAMAQRLRVVHKPCWTLRYCPYGSIVEEFPGV